MAATIKIHFLLGRYHATEWGQNVNEGSVEFPPSPLRILRALRSAYYRAWRCGENVEGAEELFNLLCGSRVSYWLPPVTYSHSRHYMPFVNDKNKQSTTKIIDSFAVLPQNQPLRVRFDCDLSPSQQQLLALLCQYVPYLGRAESWAQLTLDRDRESDRNPTREVELLAPMSSEELATFCQGLKAILPKSQLKKTPLPKTPVEVLELKTADIREGKWTNLPGVKRVNCTIFEVPSFAQQPATPKADPPNLAVFAIDGSFYPPLTQTIAYAGKLHDTIASIVGKGRNLPILTGVDDSKNILSGPHEHLRILPRVDESDRIRSFYLTAKAGFGKEEIQVLSQLLQRTIYRKEQEFSLNLLFLGKLEDYRDLDEGSIFAFSCVWESLTPFYIERHLRRKAKPDPNLGNYDRESPEWQLVRSLKCSNSEFSIPKVERLEPLPSNWNFRVDRPGKNKAISKYPYRFRLTFDTRQCGPIALGHNAHFGLGLFVPQLSN